MSPRRDDRIEDLEVVRRDAPALSTTGVIRGRSGSSAALVAVVLGFLALAIVKPWGSSPAAQRVTPSSAPTRQMIVVAQGSDDLADLRSNCDEPFAWRVYSREGEINGMPFRVWSSVTPADSARDPTDPAIPLVQVGPTIEALGYCAPWSGADAPPADVQIRAWRLAVDRGGGPHVQALTLVRVAPIEPSPFSALYHIAPDRRAGSSPPVEDWPQGRYVFLAEAEGWQRWWAVEASRPADDAAPAPTASPSGAPAASPASHRTSPVPAGGG